MDIPDSLFAEAKACAHSRGVPMRQLVEDGLRQVIRQYQTKHAAYKLRDGSFGGKGLREGLDWPAVRGAIYSGRGE